MTNFAYIARDSSGQQVTGTLSAQSVSQALQMLRAENKYPVSVKPADEAGLAVLSAGANVKVPRADILQISSQLSVMIETGVTLTEALDCIARQAEKPQVRKLVGDVVDQVQNGASFSDALARHPRSFPRMFTALIRASEKSGQLSKLLGRACGYLRDEQDTLRRVRGALVYPGIMFTFAMTTTVFLLTFVLPRFTVIYANKKAALPVPTRVLMTASDFLLHHWPMLLGGLAAVAVAVAFLIRTRNGARAWHFVQLHIPLLGKMYRKLHLSRGLRMVGTMAAAGVSLMDCVNTAHDLCPNGYFRDLWRRVGDQIQAGRQMSDPLFESSLVPRPVAQMIFSGEKGGKLAFVMEQVASFAEAELKEQIISLTRYIEPAMIVIMGLIIGGVSMALLLPIFTISKVMAAQ